MARFALLIASISLAAMGGCTLDSTGLGLDEQVPDAGMDVVTYDGSQPPQDAAKADSPSTDASDAGLDVSAQDADVPEHLDAADSSSDADSSSEDADSSSEDADSSSEDAPDGSPEDAFDSSIEDVLGPDSEDVAEVDAPEPPDAPAPVVDSTTVASDSMAVDRVRPGDGPVSADGVSDGAFVVSLYGEIVGLAMISTDASGAPAGGQQWDTYVGAATIPPEVGAGFSVGSSTWQLGAWEGQTPLNASDGSLTPVPLGAHTLQLYCANSGWFIAGQHFRVAVELAGGQLIWGPVLTY